MFIYTEWNAWWNSVGIYSTQVIAFINYKCFIKTYWNVLIVITKYFAFFSPKKVNSLQLQNFTFSTAWEIKTSFKRLIFVDIFLCTYIVVSMSFVSCTYLTRIEITWLLVLAECRCIYLFLRLAVLSPCQMDWHVVLRTFLVSWLA